MSKHPEVLWAQRSSENTKEQVRTSRSSAFFTLVIIDPGTPVSYASPTRLD